MSTPSSKSALHLDGLIVSLAAAKLALHFIVTSLGGYGYFRDELYYIACSNHLDWGFVDHPPLSIALLWLNRTLLGDSLLAIRFLPALAGAGMVVLTCLIVKQLGGGKRAQLLAGIAVIIAPVNLIIGDFFSMNAFEPMFWLSITYVLLRITQTQKTKLWLVLGTLAGLGMENKHGTAFFVAALALAILLSPERKVMFNWWFVGGAVVAGVLVLPNLFWQVTHEWPTLEFVRNAQQYKNYPLSPLEFFSSQIVLYSPVTVPLWLGGLGALLFWKNMRPARYVGLAFLLLALLFILQRGKPYYISPFVPVLMAAGAAALDSLAQRRSLRWTPVAFTIILILGGFLSLPVSLPVLPPALYIRYAEAIGFQEPPTETSARASMPQVFADRFGWEEMVRNVARVYDALSEEEKKTTAICAQNYGEAGAIDFFGGEYGLPHAISGHNSYWLWGPGDTSAQIVIVIGGGAELLKRAFEQVHVVAVHTHEYAMPFETDLPIYICRNPRIPLDQAWQSARSFI